MKVTGDSSSDGVVGVRVCLERFKRDQEERNPVVACLYTDEKDRSLWDEWLRCLVE